MARSLTGGLTTEVTASSLTPIFLMEASFSTPLRLWTGIGDLVWDSKTWTGSGDLVGISTIEETAQLKAPAVTFTLSGIPSSLISLALTEDYQGRDCKVYLAALTSSGAVVSDPYLIFQGLMDVMEMTEDGSNALFKLTVENQLVALERSNVHYYTSQRQKLDYSADEGFDLVVSLQDKEVVWGAPS